MKEKNRDLIKEFLKESNAIEDVWDARSLLQAVKAWRHMEKQDTFRVRDILEAHGIMMKYLLPIKERGHFRVVPVYMRMYDGSIKMFKPWQVVPTLVENLVDKYNIGILTTKREDMAEFIKQWHIDFESIHFAVDGNGRMGRLLMLWMWIKHHIPITIYYAKEKHEKYYPLFKN